MRGGRSREWQSVGGEKMVGVSGGVMEIMKTIELKGNDRQ